MRRLPAVLFAFSLVLSACSASGGDPVMTESTSEVGTPSTTPAPADTSQTGGTDATSTSTTASEEATATTASGRPLAPDFTLELGDGGAYSLSDGAKPVYLVFWAEW